MTDTPSDAVMKNDHLPSVPELKYFDRSIQLTAGPFISKVVLGVVSADGKNAKPEFAFAMPTPELVNFALQVLELSARPQTKAMFTQALDQYKNQINETQLTTHPAKP